MILGDTQEKAALEKDYAERLESAVDGFILAGSRLPSRDLHEIQDRRPVVLFNRVARNFPSVVTDFVDGSRQIVEHLAALGHRRIGYLGGPRNAWSDAQRWRSLSSFAIAADIEVVRSGPFFPSVEHGAQAADAGLATGATALVFFNDLLAIGALQRLEATGVTVPHDVSIVGNDDIFGSDFCNPPLTTVATQSERAGRELIDLLLGPPASSPSARIVLPTALQVRASTGPPTEVRAAPGRDD